MQPIRDIVDRMLLCVEQLVCRSRSWTAKVSRISVCLTSLWLVADLPASLCTLCTQFVWGVAATGLPAAKSDGSTAFTAPATVQGCAAAGAGRRGVSLRPAASGIPWAISVAETAFVAACTE